MKNHSFIRTPKEIEYFLSKDHVASWMRDCEGIFASWVTDPDVIKKLLPPPLEPASPIVNVYIINVFESTVSTMYKEAALIIPALYKGEPGAYTLGMLLQGSDNGMILGREVMDLPKKNADSIEVRRVGDYAYANVIRNGVCLLELELELGEYNNPDLGPAVYAERIPEKTSSLNQYCFRFDSNRRADKGTIISNMAMDKVRIDSYTKTWEPGNIALKVRSTANDPWAELPVKNVVGGGWSRLDIGLLDSQIIPLGNEMKILPYLLNRYDAEVFGKLNRML